MACVTASKSVKNGREWANIEDGAEEVEGKRGALDETDLAGRGADEDIDWVTSRAASHSIEDSNSVITWQANCATGHASANLGGI